MCTVRETPRLPEHCIQYAYVIEWEEHFGKKVVDKDSPTDMTWIFERAEERAKAFGIVGVTYNLTLGVVKNIIPAIASTNALISAACVTEVLKIMTGCNHVLKDYMQFMGQTGVSTTTYANERDQDCAVCAVRFITEQVSPTTTLQQLLASLVTKHELSRPSLNMLGSGQIVYMPHPPVLEA